MSREEFEKLFHSQRSYRASEKEAFIKGCEARQPEIDAIRARVAELETGRELLKESADLFRFYEESHRKRGPEHLQKAERNAEIAGRIESFLASPPAPMVPEGWKLVPIEPTSHQLHTAYDDHMTHLNYKQSTCHKLAADIYRAMLAAAPEVKS